MGLGFGPGGALGAPIRGIGALCELLDPAEGSAVQGFAFRDPEPDLALVELGGTRRAEVEMHVGMSIQPAVVLRLVGVEVVERDMNVLARLGGDDAIH